MRKPGSCGKPAPGIEIMMVDADGNEVTGTGPDHPGEVSVRSRGAFDTYYKDDDSYQANRRGDFHTVGDIAYRDDEGYLYICDRKTDVIISGGMNIYPAEVEAVLEQHPEIYEAAVFGIPSQQWGEAVHATVVRSPGSSLTGEGITAFAREHLAGTRCRDRWTSPTSCRAPDRASSSSASSGRRTGPAGPPRSDSARAGPAAPAGDDKSGRRPFPGA
jgi:fatty-acyl-CoA synthase/long-chain acyl-CoA synthetase